MTRLTAIILGCTCALTISACSSTEVDGDGRWVGGAKTMTEWADSHVPSSWVRVDKSVRYDDIVDDYGDDTDRDRTVFSATYRDVSETEFARFGKEELKIRQKPECEPYDAATAQSDETPYVENCFLMLYQGQRPLPREFDLFAVRTSYPDGTATTNLYLTNDPD